MCSNRYSSCSKPCRAIDSVILPRMLSPWCCCALAVVLTAVVASPETCADTSDDPSALNPSFFQGRFKVETFTEEKRNYADTLTQQSDERLLTEQTRRLVETDHLADPDRLTDNVKKDAITGILVEFPLWCWAAIGCLIMVVLVHEYFVEYRGMNPVLSHPVPQKSMALQVLALWGWCGGFLSGSMGAPLALDQTLSMCLDPIYAGIAPSISIFSGLAGVMVGKGFCGEANWDQRKARRLLVRVPLLNLFVGILNLKLLFWAIAQPCWMKQELYWISIGVGQVFAFINGLTTVPTANLWSKITPKHDMTYWMILAQAAKNFGLAVGPGIYALIVAGVQGNGPRVHPACMGGWMAMAQTMIGVVSMIISFACCPVHIPETTEELEQDKKDAQSKKIEPGPEDLEPKERKQLVWNMLWYSFERPLTLGSVEVATIMLLETAYGWRREDTGIVFTIISCVGTLLSLTSVGLLKFKSITESQVMWFGGVLGLMGTFLLFDVIPGAGIVTLLIADPIIYGAALLSCGIAEGWAARACMEGTSFNFETYRIWDGALNTMSRVIAPTVARVLVDFGGRNTYALLQLLVVAKATRSLYISCKLVWDYAKAPAWLKAQKQLEERADAQIKVNGLLDPAAMNKTPSETKTSSDVDFSDSASEDNSSQAADIAFETRVDNSKAQAPENVVA
eukprot:TRINITY_DN35664_c0_g1_i1.p1 TRINITY_DN35664_c0_g1~~TRINITY_DN35664_c0_g1_i1.p1  ORF type:complete len:680 (+),score=98.15 TRINITY_DN35664_c0_g1_i1:36-2075(+)